MAKNKNKKQAGANEGNQPGSAQNANKTEHGKSQGNEQQESGRNMDQGNRSWDEDRNMM